MKPRLFIDARVLQFMGGLKRRDREFLFNRFEMICASPGRFADCVHQDESGRTVDCHVTERFAIMFWDDFADRHLKIMEVQWAD